MTMSGTPGGLIEPNERPADAAVQEAWEETGLLVRPERLLSVYGGPECVVQYPNGDETQYVIIAFECIAEGGELQPDQHETTDVRFWSATEAAGIPLTPWLRARLPEVYAGRAGLQRRGGPRASMWWPAKQRCTSRAIEESLASLAV
ncbi:MAG: NUDIX domain-containing protein [Gemmatimonadota bacterium]|nr:NUDIX domain-containing protein [Gemmatimonadota bacterium]